MDDLDSIRTLVTLAGVFASIAGAWWLMRYQINEIRKSIQELRVDKISMWKKVDIGHEKVSLLVQQQGVISGMLRPDAVAEQVSKMTTMEVELKYLRRDVDEVRVFTILKKEPK